MEKARKITIIVPGELLEKAQRESGGGVAEAAKAGLRLLAASHAYDKVRSVRGKIQFSQTLEELKPWKS